MRDEIVNRLEEDLLGPRLPDEVLESRPSDTYLTGILWPPTEKESSEDDDSDEKSAATENTDLDLSVPTLGQSKPSSMGLSFAIDETAGTQIAVSLDFGSYVPQVISQGRQAKKTVWQRESFHLEVEVELDIGLQRLQFEVEGSNQCVEIVARVKSGPASSWLCTISASNVSHVGEYSRDKVESLAMFQSVLTLKKTGGVKFLPRPVSSSLTDDERKTQELLYRNAVEYATGHQASPQIERQNDEVISIRTNWLPRQIVPAFSEIGDPHYFAELVNSGSLSAKYLSSCSRTEALSALEALATAYERWIDGQVKEAESLPNELAQAASSNLALCKQALDRIRGGMALLESDAHALLAFQLSNQAIQQQFEWKEASTDAELSWRPFQLAFILLSLESTLIPSSPERRVFDLLWFPTGGGKTEAYLAIIGIAAWYQRLENPKKVFPNLALMRYTLRLLTAQQFSRAAALMLACEHNRRSNRFDDQSRPVAEFSIGFWVGQDASPNVYSEARAALSDPFKPSPVQIEKCFVCDRKLDWRADNQLQVVRPGCSNEHCRLGKDFGPWPVMTVDDDIYRSRPTLLIGTVDKFAQVPIKEETKELFGFGEVERTRLIIQDELHLISGPLGTMVGLYEGAFDYLLSADGNPPKIIGSTATIRRSGEQIKSVFDRESFQFPPPGLESSNSGFAVVDSSKPGRLYVGVTSAGRSPKFAIQAVAGSLMQSAGKTSGKSDEERDGYSTLLMYYQSLRELGGALVQVLDDVPDSIGIFAKARGEDPRLISEPQELTSRVSQREIVSMLKALDRNCSEPDSIDSVLATNMVSVGLDISRLGLMVLQGQPKSRSEYIQATSRVGRSSYPGLVVTVLNAAKTRDQSSFESFENWHSAIYRDVEPASATPFAPRAQERAVHVALTTMLRYSIEALQTSPLIADVDSDEIETIKAALIARCSRIAGAGSIEVKQAEDLLDDFLEYWDRKRPARYKDDQHEDAALLQSAEELARKSAVGTFTGEIWPVPNSMRSVEPNSKIRITDRASRFGAGTKGVTGGELSG